MKDTPAPSTAPPALKALTLDTELYQRYLDTTDMTDDQTREFVEALWTIIVSFVDLGFSVAPAENSCGQLCASFEAGAANGSTTLNSEKNTQQASEGAA